MFKVIPSAALSYGVYDYCTRHINEFILIFNLEILKYILYYK